MQVFNIASVTGAEKNVTSTLCRSWLVGWVNALRPGQQFFSHVWMEPPLPGYKQYFWGVNMSLLKDTNTAAGRSRTHDP